MDGSAAAKVTQTHNVCTHISTLASRDACSLEVTSGRVYIMLSCVDTLTCSGVCSWQGQKRSSTGRGVVLAVVAGAAVLAILALTAPQGNSLQQIQLARPAAPAVSWTSLSAAQQQALKTQVMESASMRVNENEQAMIFDLFIHMPRSLISQSLSVAASAIALPSGKADSIALIHCVMSSDLLSHYLCTFRTMQLFWFMVTSPD